MGHSIDGEFSRGARLQLIPGGADALTSEQREVLRNDAAKIRFSRQRRRKFFGSAMFAETAWDILLVLYVADGELPRPGASDLARSTDAPFSTTSRWLTYLDDEGLVSVGGRNSEGDATRVELTHKGRSLLDEYFLELRAAEVFPPQETDAEASSAR